MKRAIFFLFIMCSLVTIGSLQAQQLDRKQFRSAESLFRQVIDDSTKALRVEVVPMPENVPFKAAETKKNQSIAHILNNLIDPGSNRLRIEFTNFQLFPYDKIVNDWNNNSKVFRYMLSPTGNDSNNGFTWTTAKRTVQSVLDELPQNLQGHDVHLLFKSGTYKPFDTKKVNGTVYIWWLGTSYNTETNAKSVWVRNGAVTSFIDDQLVFDNDSTSNKSNTIKFVSDNTGNISFISELGAPTGSFKFCAERIVIKSTTSSNPSRLVNVEKAGLYAHSLLLDMGSVDFAALGGTVSRGYLMHLRVIGGTGDATNPNRTYWWQGALCMHADYEPFYLGNYNIAQGVSWETSFEPTNAVSLDVVGISILWNTWGGANSKMYFTPTRGMKFTSTITVTTPPEVGIRSEASGVYVAYTPAECNFTDASTNPHIVKNMTTSVITSYISSKIVDDGTNIILSAPTKIAEVATTPTVTQDTQGSFYIKGDKFIILYNNAGTTKYRYLDLTTTDATWTYTTTEP